MALRPMVPESALREFCERNGIRGVWAFGSAVRDDFSPTSDVDLVVEFEEGRVPGLIRFVQLQRELADLFGHEVDLFTKRQIESSPNHIRRSEVLSTMEPVYAAR